MRSAKDYFGESPKRARGPRPLQGSDAFTIIELLIVMAIIIVLAGLVLGISGYAHEKGARSRAEAEIAAMSAALESYKADNGVYPSDAATDALTAMTDGSFATKSPPDPKPTSYNADPKSPSYTSASFLLYAQLSGNLNGDRASFASKQYFAFKPQMLYPANGKGTVTGIVDPFGNVYGYSTSQAKYVEDPVNNPNCGFNPTYDAWSTSGTDNAKDAGYEKKWIKNW